MTKRLIVYVLVLYSIVAVTIILYLLWGFPFFIGLFISSWAPAIAAFTVAGLLRGGSGLRPRDILRRWTMVRLPLRSYLLAAAYVMVTGGAVLLYLLFGGTIEIDPELKPGRILLMLPLILFTGALGEEPGWRGLMLEELQQRWSGLSSALITAPFWLIFHIPLWLRPEFGYQAIPFPAFILSTTALSVSMNYLVNSSGGSLFIASFVHVLMNFSLGFIPSLGIDPASFFWYYAALQGVYALLLAGISGKRLGLPDTAT